MPIDITINGVPKWNASSYSAAEDATPIDPSDTSGGTGQFTVAIPETTDSMQYRTGAIVLTDGSQGSTTGKVSSISGDGVTATLTVDSRMALLNVTRTAAPYVGTLGGAFTYYLGLVGITTGITIDPTISGRAVTFPGWSGLVWDQIRALMSAQQVETSLVGDQITLRPLRARVAQNYRDSVEQWTIADTNLAQNVAAYYYQGQQRTDLAYPLGGWTTSVQAYQVDAGKTDTYDISLDAATPAAAGQPAISPLGVSLTSINQPVCVSSVDKNYSASSVYTVAGNDGLPVPPAQWLADGGSVTVAINPDTRSVTLTIKGGANTRYAPYTIGMSSGSNTYYSSLRIQGTGVFYNRQMLTLPTGNSVDRAPTVTAPIVDNIFINTYDDAYHALLWTCAAWTGGTRTWQVTTSGINRKGDPASLQTLTMGQFNVDPDFAGLTMVQFNTKFSGPTMRQFNDLQYQKVNLNFANQAFGNVAGARVFLDGGWNRINSVSAISQDGVAYSATQDDTMADFNVAYAGMTMAQFNAANTSKANAQFNSTPFLAGTTPH